jgi:hypothetical protein
MRYFLPHFKIAALQAPQDCLCSKIGGLPWGLPPDRWPVCCGYPQKLLAQLRHDPPMLDLGQPGAVLHLFQCLECLGINNDAGCAAFILHESHLGDGLVTISRFDHKSEVGERLIGEFWIDGWDERNDGIPPERLPEFFAWETWNPLTNKYPAIEWFDQRDATRFGGSPRWTGDGPSSPYDPAFEFLLQLNNDLYIDGQLPTPDQVGSPIFRFPGTDGDLTDQSEEPLPNNVRINAPWLVLHGPGKSTYWANFTNLGSDGTAFVFINRRRSPHDVRWYWTR